MKLSSCDSLTLREGNTILSAGKSNEIATAVLEAGMPTCFIEFIAHIQIQKLNQQQKTLALELENACSSVAHNFIHDNCDKGAVNIYTDVSLVFIFHSLAAVLSQLTADILMVTLHGKISWNERENLKITRHKTHNIREKNLNNKKQSDLKQIKGLRMEK